MNEQRFSDEFLNAFVDDQLTPEEKSRAYPEISANEALNRQVCELRKLRDLVRLAYREPPLAARPVPASPRRRLGGLAAALMVGLALGWALHGPAMRDLPASPAVAIDRTATAVTPDPRPPQVARVATAPAERRVAPLPAAAAGTAAAATPATAASAATAVTAATATAAPATVAMAPVATPDAPAAGDEPPVRVLVHVSNGNVARQGEALDEVEALARHYRANGQNARIAVIVNGEGLGLVRSDTAAHAGRIQRLLADYPNVTIAACLNTIETLRRERGISARLLPGIGVIDSGVAEIMRRQQRGWAYVQV